MPVSCRLISRTQFFSDDYDLQPGDMWPRCSMQVWRALVEEWRASGSHRDDSLVSRLSDQYLAERIDQRPPLTVVLPNGDQFEIDSQITGGGGRGWHVSGEPPHITVAPSINVVGHWHGWLRDGVLTEV